MALYWEFSLFEESATTGLLKEYLPSSPQETSNCEQTSGWRTGIGSSQISLMCMEVSIFTTSTSCMSPSTNSQQLSSRDHKGTQTQRSTEVLVYWTGKSVYSAALETFQIWLEEDTNDTSSLKLQQCRYYYSNTSTSNTIFVVAVREVWQSCTALWQVGHFLTESQRGLRSYTTRTGVDATKSNSDTFHHKKNPTHLNQ